MFTGQECNSFMRRPILLAGARSLIFAFLIQYTQYSFTPETNAAAASTAAKADLKKASNKKAAQSPVAEKEGDAGVSGAPVVAEQARIVAQEERVEYRDQDGNLLDADQVKELEGKVEFKTRYETRTRIIDEQGNEVLEDDDEEPETEFVAPPHPDVQGVDQETKENAAGDSNVPDAAESVQGEREAEVKKPKPASEGAPEASARDEL